jgi:hypothetical protein
MAAAGTVITCPECSKKFKGKGDVQGKKVRCPFCKETFKVGAEADDKEAVRAAKETAPPEPAAGTYNADDLDINPYGVTNQDLKNRCPNCANEMADANATICLFCGYNTLTRQWGKTVKTMAHTPGQIVMHLLPAIAVFAWIVILLCGLLYFSLILPNKVGNSWMSFLDHESLRMWGTIIAMGVLWASGMFCYQRFICEPLPPEEEKD